MGRSAPVNTIWIVLLIGGISQGLFLFTLLFSHKRGKKNANRFLAFLILSVSLLLTEHLLFRFRLAVIDDHRHFISFATPVSYLIGPLYYLHAKSLFKEGFQFNIRASLHFLPAIICLLNYLPGGLYLAGLHSNQPILNSRYFILWLSGYVHMGIFILQTGLYTYRSFGILPNDDKSRNQNDSIYQMIYARWFKKMTGLMIALMGLHAVALIIFVGFRYIRGAELVLVSGLTAVIYTIGYITLKQPEIFSGPLFKKSAEKYQKSPLSAEQTGIYAEKLLQYMAKEKPYLRHDLKLHDLAASLSISTNHLSQFLNQEFGLNFSDFINEYRVKEVQTKLFDPAYSHLTQLAIAFECGFNSKASFNRAFKKITQMTPSQFIKSNQK